MKYPPALVSALLLTSPALAAEKAGKLPTVFTKIHVFVPPEPLSNLVKLRSITRIKSPDAGWLAQALKKTLFTPSA